MSCKQQAKLLFKNSISTQPLLAKLLLPVSVRPYTRSLETTPHSHRKVLVDFGPLWV